MPSVLPEKFEIGTFNTSGIAGLNAALKWIKDKTVEKLYKDEEEKRNKLLNLLSEYDFLTVVGNIKGKEYVGIVSCLFAGISSDSAGSTFAERGISVRAGLQCAPKAHQFLGTFPSGTIRFSVNCLTENADFDELRNALDDIRMNL